MKFFVKFFAGVTIVAVGIVVGLFLFFGINEAVAINEAQAIEQARKNPPRDITLSNGSTVHYHGDPPPPTTVAKKAR